MQVPHRSPEAIADSTMSGHDHYMGEWLRSNAELIGLAAAIAAIVAGVWGARTYGNRRMKLVVDVRRARVVNRTIDGVVEVRVGGQVVDQPTLVTIDVLNVGPRDVASGSFDKGKPIVVRLPSTTRCLALLPVEGLASDEIRLGDGNVQVGPALLKRGARVTVQALCDGTIASDTITVDDPPLIDVDTKVRVDEPDPPLFSETRFSRLINVMAVLVALVSVVASLLFTYLADRAADKVEELTRQDSASTGQVPINE